MTIAEARAEFEACWAKFTPPGASALGSGPSRTDLGELERAVMQWFSAALKGPPHQLRAALRETAEAREIVRYGKLEVPTVEIGR